jgi:hypothetical protein
MNTQLLTFFRTHFASGRICLVGANDIVGQLIRNGQAKLTPDKKPSKWSHTFIMGEQRDDSRNDGSIYIYESDLHVSVAEWQVINGPQESRLVKWCNDTIEHACVLGLNITPVEQKSILRKALELTGDEKMKYPVAELFGTLWAILTRRLSKKNIFDDKYAVQCSTFVRMCCQAIGKDILAGSPTDISNTSPEKIYQSQAFTFRQEWHK